MKQKIQQLRELTVLERVLMTAAVVIGSALLYFAAQVIVSLLVIIALSLAGNSQSEIDVLVSSSTGVQFIFSILVAGFLGSSIYGALKWLGVSPLRFLRLNKRPTPSHLVEVFFLYGIYFLVLIVSTAILSETTPVDIDQKQDLGPIAREGWGLAVTFVRFVIIAPVIEEILFRGLLFRSVKKFSGRIAGYVIVSLLFGAAHLEFDNLNYIAAIDTLIFSAFLIYIYEKHDSLYSPIALHAMKNGIAFLALFVLL